MLAIRFSRWHKPSSRLDLVYAILMFHVKPSALWDRQMDDERRVALDCQRAWQRVDDLLARQTRRVADDGQVTVIGSCSEVCREARRMSDDD
jgi:hypothetical protein